MRQHVLIMGCTGAVGHVLLAQLSLRDDLDVYGTVRVSEDLSKWFAPQVVKNIRGGVDAHDIDSVISVVNEIQPDVVINCIGIIKQVITKDDAFLAIMINALLPHRIATICKNVGARLIHLSTDCVFSGKDGNYNESMPADAVDLYGRSKCLGEVEYSNCVTLRKSVIGHELKGGHGLLEWFLAQEGWVKGFTNAIYSGVTAHELARVIGDYVLSNEKIEGIYHVSSSPISKYALLELIAKRYRKNIEIERYEGIRLNRSLDSTKFRNDTGYLPPSWEKMVDDMYNNFMAMKCYKHQ